MRYIHCLPAIWLGILVGSWQAAAADLLSPEPIRDAHRVVSITGRYLHLPVQTGAPKRRMSIQFQGRILREFNIELAEGEPGFWVFIEVESWKSKAVEIHVDRLPPNSKGLEAIQSSDEMPAVAEVYRESLRPQFHFSSRVGWLNDPNGLVFIDGEYHLFYQHNPYGWAWGNMHWGHAVSPDLVHWKELPIAIYPRQFGDWAFSGSAVIDTHNTAGFARGDEPVMVAAYTSTGRGECIVFSNDRGRTWREYNDNPVVKHKGRDPKLLWHEPSKRWIMAVYDEVDKVRYIAFFSSPDLRDWKFESRIEGFFECPEMFELPVDGKTDHRKWVLYDADGGYIVGQFDGRQFTVEQPKHPNNYGNCFYASQTFSNIPESDGRRIQIGWGRVTLPGMAFNQQMLFPCQLTLRATEQGARMFTWPVKEIEKLYARSEAFTDLPVADAAAKLKAFNAPLLDVEMEIELAGATAVDLDIHGTAIRYDALKSELLCDKKTAPLAALGGRIRLRLLIDRASIEIYGDSGRVYMPIGGVLPEPNHPLQITATGGRTLVRSMAIHELKSAWTAP